MMMQSTVVLGSIGDDRTREIRFTARAFADDRQIMLNLKWHYRSFVVQQDPLSGL